MLHPIPCVWLGGQPLTLGIVDHVVPNNPACGILAAKYLIDRGCSGLAYVNNVPMHVAFTARRDTFTCLLEDHLRPVAKFETPTQELERELWDGNRMCIDLGRLVARVVRRKQVPDGFFLPTDQQASVFQRLMIEQGLVAEKDFFTVSCNRDEPWLATMNPRAATIDTRPVEVGRTAARQLMRRIENPGEEVVTITVRPELIEP